MNLVDSSGWLEYFAAAPNAGFFASAIEDSPRLIVPSIALLEVFKIILRQRDEMQTLRAAAQMRMGKIGELDETEAIEAANLGVRLRLALADSVILATARISGLHCGRRTTTSKVWTGCVTVKKRKNENSGYDL